MSLRDIIVGVQMLTMIVLALMFLREGGWQFAVAQAAYVVATFVLFIAAPTS